MPTPHRYQEIACQQVLTEDSSVFSIQWTDLPPDIGEVLTGEVLLARYLDYIRRCTLGLIRPTTLENGIEFRLGCSGLSLISFLPPSLENGSATLRICGGALVQPRQCDRGELRFAAGHLPDKVRVSLQLSDFCPLILGGREPSILRLWLYRITQAAIHRLVTIRFLSLLYNDLTATRERVRVVNVSVRTGRPV